MVSCLDIMTCLSWGFVGCRIFLGKSLETCLRLCAMALHQPFSWRTAPCLPGDTPTLAWFCLECLQRIVHGDTRTHHRASHFLKGKSSKTCCDVKTGRMYRIRSRELSKTNLDTNGPTLPLCPMEWCFVFLGQSMHKAQERLAKKNDYFIQRPSIQWIALGDFDSKPFLHHLGQGGDVKWFGDKQTNRPQASQKNRILQQTRLQGQPFPNFSQVEAPWC